MPLVLEFFEEFKERQGCPFILSRDGGWIFANGASSDGRYQHFEPPEDERERLRMQMGYTTLALEEATAEFRDVQRVALEQASIHKLRKGPAPVAAVVDHLKDVKCRVVTLRRQLAQQQRSFDRLIGTKERERYAEELDQRRAEMNALMNSVASIQI